MLVVLIHFRSLKISIRFSFTDAEYLGVAQHNEAGFLRKYSALGYTLLGNT